MALASAAPKRAKLFVFGKSWDGRPLRIFVVSSEKNIARLEDIRKQTVDLADGKADAAGIIAKLPATVWVNETVHGNESASFESGMWLAYNLVASRNKSVTQALEDVVVIINPVFNPDGHERFVVWNRSIAVGTPFENSYEYYEPSWVHGRTNHFRFDMNRDRVAMTQRETQAEAAELRRWYPQIYLDQHGQTSEYFFPPNSMSVNSNADRERLEKWTQVLGRAYAKAFDERGWLYFVRDTFDFYFPGYLDTYATYIGAIGMTHETDGGRYLNGTKNDGTPLTLELGMAKHFTTAMVSVRVAHERRAELLTSFHAFRRNGVTGQHSGTFKRVVVKGDLRELKRLRAQLAYAGIESAFAAEPFEHADAHSYWTEDKTTQKFDAGVLVIDLAQGMGQFAKAVLEPGQDFEPEFTKEQIEVIKKLVSKEPDFGQSDSTGFYDITGWTPIYGRNLEAYWMESAPKIATTTASEVGEFKLPKSNIGWIVRYSDRDDILALFRLAEQGVRVRVLDKVVKLAGFTANAGDFVIFKDRNDDDAPAKIETELGKTWPSVVAIENSFPEAVKGNLGIDARPIRAPKVGVVFGAGDWTSQFGHTWYVLEQELGISFVPLHMNALSGDLSSFSAILLPSGRYGSVPSKLNEWIRNGGCAIVLGGSWAIGENKLMNLEAAKLEKDEEIHPIPGTIYKAELDDRSFLSYGYGKGANHKIPFAIQVDGDTFYKGKKEINPVVAFPATGRKLLSGWSWPENSEKALAGALAVAETELGGGRVVYFAWDPCERALWPGQYKLLMNAILLGPR
jgi:hypothetical protein